MSAEYDYRVIYLKSDRLHCYGNVTRAEVPARRDFRPLYPGVPPLTR